jgi:hypothetical protein
MAETLIFHWFEVIFHLILITEGYLADVNLPQTLVSWRFRIG